MDLLNDDNDFRFLADYIINKVSKPSKTSAQDAQQTDNTGFYDTQDEDADPNDADDQSTDHTDHSEADQSTQDDQSSMWDDYFFGDNSSLGQTPYDAQSNQGFQSFGSYDEGKNALINQLQLYQTGKTRNDIGPDSTLLHAMSVYAPAADHNDPQGYAAFIAKKLGITTDTPISKIDTKKWADAIEQVEGNTKGNNPGNLRKFQSGGMPVAITPEQQFYGLNDENLDSLILPLEGSNLIRGLDNGEPVLVKDSVGTKKILRGKNDTIRMKGKIFEKRL